LNKRIPPRIAKFKAIIATTNAPCSSIFYVVFLQLITDGSPNKHPGKKNKAREEEKRMPADTCKKTIRQ
jgi:hypothetical protein